MPHTSNYKNLSLWLDELGEELAPGPQLTEDISADIVIIGAGYTGLWTAYYLKQLDPDLKVVVLEEQISGFGASGRNGGWLMGSLAGENKLLAAMPAAERDLARSLIYGIVDEVARVLNIECIDCDYQKSGTFIAATRYPEQESMLRQELALLHSSGHSEADFHWLDAGQLKEKVRFGKAYGAIFTPHTATVHPAKLIRGLRHAVSRQGVLIYEQSPVLSTAGKRVDTPSGSVNAAVVVNAIEGFSYHLKPHRQLVLPVQSLMIATEPLDDARWDEIGLSERPTFGDASRLSTYGQRSADGRMVFGARGNYGFGGYPRSKFKFDDREFAWREQLLLDLFPTLRGVRFSHHWGGTLGLSRRFTPHAVFDPQSGLGTAGGYGGEGVGASNLMARTLADLVLGRDSLLCRMPWAFRGAAGKQLRRWEPEPLRWLGYHAIAAIANWEEKVYLESTASSWKKATAARIAERVTSILS